MMNPEKFVGWSRRGMMPGGKMVCEKPYKGDLESFMIEPGKKRRRKDVYDPE